MAVDTTINVSHVLTIAGCAATIIGQWVVQSFRLKSLEKIAGDNQMAIASMKEEARKGPSLLCSIHEQRLTKLEEEMRVQYVGLKGDLDQIIQMLKKTHPPR